MVLSDARIARSKRTEGKGPFRLIVTLTIGFLLGCLVCTAVILNIHTHFDTSHHDVTSGPFSLNPLISSQADEDRIKQSRDGRHDENEDTPSSVLDGRKILVAIAAFDFAQLPHLEEVLDAYLDMCASGAKVDVYVHATVPYPVSLIDLLNSRLQCTNPSPKSGFSLTIVLKSPSVRLHLVDFHRTLFYDRVHEYDVFIFSEDDIRVTPKTIAAYLHETERVEQLVGRNKASDFNVGVARYEYNYPPDVVIDDKTRHVTQNVTRVYWEHSWTPPIPKSVDAVSQAPLSQYYVHMTNHHQGMFIATRELLLAWKERPGCQFDVVRDRPGLKNKPSQPAEGTQRVWMSSQMLYGNRHCDVQQVIPMDKFGSLTVLHLPNKNYRRVGKKGRLGGFNSPNTTQVQFADGTEQFEGPSKLLLTAMDLHIEMRRQWKAEPQRPYKGIQMVDEVQGARPPKLDERMRAFLAYESRGGVMSEQDMEQLDLS